MSPRLPNLRPREAVNAFVKNGFSIVGQKGSHIRLTNSAGVQLIIPQHSTDLKRPLLKALIKHAGMTEDEFRELL
jgi:predicted RNA binding protein YcfA (HicA-like mRNA interferase family)